MRRSPTVETRLIASLHQNLRHLRETLCGSSFLEIAADGATATVHANGLPSWGDFYLQVQANFGWRSLWSSLHTTCGTNDHPTVGLSIAAPQVVFLNDDNRSTRYYRVQVTATCEVDFSPADLADDADWGMI